MKKLNCIMLVDDNPDDNFIHERVIRKSEAAHAVVAIESASDALNYLKSKSIDVSERPDLIFLDINLPGMNGWEFIEEYKKLDPVLQAKMVVVMLSTSDNPDDIARAAAEHAIAQFRSKPLTKEMLSEVITSLN